MADGKSLGPEAAGVLAGAAGLAWALARSERGKDGPSGHRVAEAKPDAPLVSPIGAASIQDAVDWASTHGLVMRALDGFSVLHAPFAGAPRKIPAEAFGLAYELGPLFAVLSDAVRRDEEWLLSTLERTADVDPFTGRLVELARMLRDRDGAQRQTSVLGILRSDYMIDSRRPEPKSASSASTSASAPPASCGRLLQVELNTVAAGFAGHSARVSELHAGICAPAVARRSGQAAPTSSAAAPAGYSAAPASATVAVVPGPCFPAVHKTASDAPSTADVAGAGGLPHVAATTAAAVASFGLPPNHSLGGMAASLAAAHAEYTRQRSADACPPTAASDAAPVVLFVVQPEERNFADQRHIADALERLHGIRVLRRTLTELADTAVLASSCARAEAAPARGPVEQPAFGSPLASRRLFIRGAAAQGRASARDGARASTEGNSAAGPWAEAVATVDPGLTRSAEEVAVVYLRSGYGPGDYGGEDATLEGSAEWQARASLERSAAIMCPNVWLQLVGAKKVQQVLAQPGVVERFMGATHDTELLRSCFAGLWSLDPDELKDPVALADARAAADRARADPSGFVLKPQREGGGHNFFGADIVHALENWSADKLRGFILMERINPDVQAAVMVKAGRYAVAQTVCEFGIYTGLLGTGSPRSFSGEGIAEAADGILVNATFGHLVRTKALGMDEGGVAAGFAVLDSPHLVASL